MTDPTKAVDEEAQFLYERYAPEGSIDWVKLSAMAQLRFREMALPMIAAAAPISAATIREVVRQICNGAGDTKQRYCDDGVAQWLEMRAARKEFGA